MKSYFFIPASNRKFIAKAKELTADFFILDLEDSVLVEELEMAINNIAVLDNKEGYFVRVPLGHNTEENVKLIRQMQHIGFDHFVLPKLRSAEELKFITQSLPRLFEGRQILLVEHPHMLLDLKLVLMHFPFFGIALGSHDYTNVMQMQHTDKNLEWARHCLLNHAKAFDTVCLDTASMNISNKGAFLEECRQAYQLGFDGKMLIHPMQLQVLESNRLYSDADLVFALKIRDKLLEVGGIHNFSVARIDDQVVEKPHLNKYLEILKLEGYEAL